MCIYSYNHFYSCWLYLSYFITDLQLTLVPDTFLRELNLNLTKGQVPSPLDIRSAIGPAAIVQRKNLLCKSMTLGITQQWWLSKRKDQKIARKFLLKYDIKARVFTLKKPTPLPKENLKAENLKHFIQWNLSKDKWLLKKSKYSLRHTEAQKHRLPFLIL